MTTANNAVRDAFNLRVPSRYRVTDITNYSVAVSDATAASALPNTHAGRWSTLLASLPRAALHFNPGLRFPALAFMKPDHHRPAGRRHGQCLGRHRRRRRRLRPRPAAGHHRNRLVGDLEWGSSEQPAPTSAPSTCFNIALFTVGTKWDLTTTSSRSTPGPTTSRSPEVAHDHVRGHARAAGSQDHRTTDATGDNYAYYGPTSAMASSTTVA